MYSILCYFTIILSVGVMNFGLTQPNSAAQLTCDQLPKLEMASNELLATCGPLPYDFSLRTLFDCATQVYISPKRGHTGYRGSSPLIKGPMVNVYRYTVGNDNKTIHSMICSTGVKSTWYISAGQISKDGCFYCIYSCDGSALDDFGCVSNNEAFLPQQEEAVAQARQVQNGDKIHRANINCPSHGCYEFS